MVWFWFISEIQVPKLVGGGSRVLKVLNSDLVKNKILRRQIAHNVQKPCQNLGGGAPRVLKVLILDLVYTVFIRLIAAFE